MTSVDFLSTACKVMCRSNHEVMEAPISWPEYYKERFSSIEKIEKYLKIKKQTRDALFIAIGEHVGNQKRLLEAGCGTSTASVILNREGHINTALDFDPEMIEIGQNLNKEIGTNVEYTQGDIFNLDFDQNEFDGLFSHGVIEHFNEDEVVAIVNEGLRVAAKYILSFPTVCNRSPELRGDENPWSYFKWNKIFKQSSGRIDRVYSMYSKRPLREAINIACHRKLPWVAPNLVFVISR